MISSDNVNTNFFRIGESKDNACCSYSPDGQLKTATCQYRVIANA